MIDRQISDESLVLDVKLGDKQAGGLLYERYKKLLFAFFYNYSKDAEHSEDMVQQTFEKVLKYLPNYKGKGSFKSWIFSIARNLHIDHHRKVGKLRTTELEKASGDVLSEEDPGDAIQREKMGFLEKAIDALDPDKKELLIMTKIKGIKYREVAEIYGVNEGTIKVRMCRIMRELKKLTLGYAANHM